VTPAEPCVEAQKAYFREEDSAHCRWPTEGPYFAATEAALLSTVTLAPGERLLEVGCGPGANLVHLRRRLGAAAQLFGAELSAARARFAARAAAARCACADAARLPFADGAFSALLIRDLLHHVPDRAAVLAEAARVLGPGGRLTLIEPNRYSPIIFAAAAAERAERGMLASTAARARGEAAAAGFTGLRVEVRQPFPLARVLLHHRLGRPGLGARPGVARALAGLDALLGRLPRALWAYFIVSGEKVGGAPPPPPRSPREPV
jgi:SAM-dependent methyltransferase